MSIIAAKQLHQQTKAVLNQLEQGESLAITRNGRTIGHLEPLAAAEPAAWSDIMAEVWRAQQGVKSGGCVPNPVLQERQRRRPVKTAAELRKEAKALLSKPGRKVDTVALLRKLRH